jgi:RecB family exonuclease
MLAISNSEIKAWQRCRRMWYLTYYLGLQPATPEVTGVRILGTRVHTALQGKYGYDLDPLMILRMLYATALQQHPDWESELLTEQDTTLKMVEGYLEWISETGADAGLEVVATEEDVTVPLPGLEGVRLRAKLDQVLLDHQTGLLSFLDHKTGDLAKVDGLDKDPQFRFYSVVQRLRDTREPGVVAVDGGIMNVLRRTKRSARSKPPYYIREPVRYNDEVLDASLRRIRSVCREITTYRDVLDEEYAENSSLEHINKIQREGFPPNPIERDCDWRCPASSGLCVAMDDGSDWSSIITKSGRYKLGDPYQYYADDPLADVRAALARG